MHKTVIFRVKRVSPLQPLHFKFKLCHHNVLPLALYLRIDFSGSISRHICEAELLGKQRVVLRLARLRGTSTSNIRPSTAPSNMTSYATKARVFLKPRARNHIQMQTNAPCYATSV